MLRSLSLFVIYASGICTTTATAGMSTSATQRTAAEVLRKDYGYYFNEDGEMRNDETGDGFEFNVSDDRSENQRRYEELGEIITRYIYELLESEGKLKRLHIPLQETEDHGRGFIFHSEDAFECDKLMLIIHGAGVVRAGQWSRRLIINHSLESGSQLPYIKKARELGYGVLVLNSNQRRDDSNGEIITDIQSPEQHFKYVWKEIVEKKCIAKHVAIVAHSYGGHITVNGALNIPAVIRKTFAVAFTDSVHFSGADNHKMSEWMNKNVCNWVSDSGPLDTPLKSSNNNCPRVSAGTPIHEETSWKAFDSVWKFIEERWQNLNSRKKKKKKNTAEGRSRNVNKSKKNASYDSDSNPENAADSNPENADVTNPVNDVDINTENAADSNPENAIDSNPENADVTNPVNDVDINTENTADSNPKNTADINTGDADKDMNANANNIETFEEDAKNTDKVDEEPMSQDEEPMSQDEEPMSQVNSNLELPTDDATIKSSELHDDKSQVPKKNEEL